MDTSMLSEEKTDESEEEDTDGSASCASESKTKTRKIRQRQVFRRNWLQYKGFQGWLIPHKDKTRAACKFCYTVLTAKKATLVRHAKSQKHIEYCKSEKLPKLTSVFLGNHLKKDLSEIDSEDITPRRYTLDIEKDLPPCPVQYVNEDEQYIGLLNQCADLTESASNSISKNGSKIQELISVPIDGLKKTEMDENDFFFNFMSSVVKKLPAMTQTKLRKEVFDLVHQHELDLYS